MGLTVLVLVAAFAFGRLAGGPGPLAAPPLRRVSLLVAALGVHFAEPLVASEVAYSYPLCLAISATLMVQFAAGNLRTPGVALAAAGVCANALVVVVNGAMPVSEAAAVRAGIPVERLALDTDGRHEPLDGATRMAPLADRIPVPIPGHREVDSLGDVAIAAGAGLYAFSAAYRRRGIFTESGIMNRWEPAERC
ncbi:DUF5317 domain-containing protein [Sporichthya polymorpha]|uniref:DUF5317 domain-containing protein n=1 Tax=Sporichthya polymorpha TaxID=35751 RepID=UPI000365D9AF|nr:DUF5317 domain-containing protein [Sporichthya polymorpha]